MIIISDTFPFFYNQNPLGISVENLLCHIFIRLFYIRLYHVPIDTNSLSE